MKDSNVLTHWKFLLWKSRIEAAQCRLESVKVCHVVAKDESDFYSAFIECTLVTGEGNRMHRGLMLRGPAVVVIPVIRVQGRSEPQTLTVLQRRVGNGEMTQEFPAGSIDAGQDAEQAAIQELQEELGLKVQRSELIQLTETPLLALTSACDEAVAWYATKLTMTEDQYMAYSGTRTGIEAHGEHITVQGISFAQLEKASNYQPLVGLSLLRKKKLI